MKKKLTVIICVILAVSIIAGTSVAFAGYGDENDPLITLSYLEDVFTVKLLTSVESMIADYETALETRVQSLLEDSEFESFSVVSLSSGQTLTGAVGTEIMLRIGTAVCSASGSPGLIDVSDAGSIDNGSSLVTNHLYMVTIDGRGVKATSDVKVLVRGSYTVK